MQTDHSRLVDLQGTPCMAAMTLRPLSCKALPPLSPPPPLLGGLSPSLQTFICPNVYLTLWLVSVTWQDLRRAAYSPWNSHLPTPAWQHRTQSCLIMLVELRTLESLPIAFWSCRGAWQMRMRVLAGVSHECAACTACAGCDHQHLLGVKLFQPAFIWASSPI